MPRLQILDCQGWHQNLMQMAPHQDLSPPHWRALRWSSQLHTLLFHPVYYSQSATILWCIVTWCDLIWCCAGVHGSSILHDKQLYRQEWCLQLWHCITGAYHWQDANYAWQEHCHRGTIQWHSHIDLIRISSLKIIFHFVFYKMLMLMQSDFNHLEPNWRSSCHGL